MLSSVVAAQPVLSLQLLRPVKARELLSSRAHSGYRINSPTFSHASCGVFESCFQWEHIVTAYKLISNIS